MVMNPMVDSKNGLKMVMNPEMVESKNGEESHFYHLLYARDLKKHQANKQKGF